MSTLFFNEGLDNLMYAVKRQRKADEGNGITETTPPTDGGWDEVELLHDVEDSTEEE